MEKFIFMTPCTACVVGPTSSGKTQFLFQLLRNREKMFSKNVDQIIWCYSIWQKEYNEFKDDIVFNEGLFDISNIQGDFHTLLILDDQMKNIGISISEIFTVSSHHRNISVFLVSQNLFFKNPHMRDVALNSQYLILFNQRRDVSQVNILAGQVMPGERKKFMNVYKEATSKPYGYLLCNFHPSNTSRFSIHLNILPSEVETVYFPE